MPVVAVPNKRSNTTLMVTCTAPGYSVVNITLIFPNKTSLFISTNKTNSFEFTASLLIDQNVNMSGKYHCKVFSETGVTADETMMDGQMKNVTVNKRFINNLHSLFSSSYHC